MARDAKGAARILAVQSQMRKIEEAKLGELQGKLHSLRQEQISLISAMNEDGALQNLFLDTMATRMKSLVEQEKTVEQQVNIQAIAVRNEAGKEKAAEKLAKRRADDEQARLAQKQLDEVLEVFVRPPEAQASDKLLKR